MDESPTVFDILTHFARK